MITSGIKGSKCFNPSVNFCRTFCLYKKDLPPRLRESVLEKKRLGFSRQEPVKLSVDNFDELKRKNVVHGKKSNKYLPADFLGTKEEEFELQQRLLKVSFLDRPMKGEGNGELVEKFKKYWVQCSQTIQIYHYSDIEEEKEQFIEVSVTSSFTSADVLVLPPLPGAIGSHEKVHSCTALAWSPVRALLSLLVWHLPQLSLARPTSQAILPDGGLRTDDWWPDLSNDVADLH